MYDGVIDFRLPEEVMSIGFAGELRCLELRNIPSMRKYIETKSSIL